MPERDSIDEGSPSCSIGDTLRSCCSLKHDSKGDDDTVDEVKNGTWSTGNEKGELASDESKTGR